MLADVGDSYFIPFNCILEISLDNPRYAELALVNNVRSFIEPTPSTTWKAPKVNLIIRFVQDLSLFQKLVLAMKEQAMKRNESATRFD
jgi:hypothetical protein